jgi:hypothetical protein
MNPADSPWFYARNQQKVGPVSFAELQRLATAGQIQPTAMILQQGALQWVPASSVPELFAQFLRTRLPSSRFRLKPGTRKARWATTG